MSTNERSPAPLKKASRLSAGLLMYRVRGETLEVLLVHLGGPFWTRKDQWFIPKGALEAGEEELAAAMREFAEETGITPKPPFLELGSVQHNSGKRVIAWAFAGDADPSAVRSNTFRMEWPPRSGKFQEFPEIDRAEFFDKETAKVKMHSAEFEFLPRLQRILERDQQKPRDSTAG
jgi:predicted NUDIX family NTP pyrophosphohydrolase